MKKTLALLAALSLSGCSALTDSPDPMANLTAQDALEQLPAETRPADGVTPEDAPNLETMMLGDYEVSFNLPEGKVASQSAWDARPTMILVAEQDLSNYEGDGLFMYHQIQIKEDQQVSLEMASMEMLYSSYEPMTVEIAGEEYQRILYYSEYGDFNGVAYLKQVGNDILAFYPGTPSQSDSANSPSDLEMIELIKSFEIESGL